MKKLFNESLKVSIPDEFVSINEEEIKSIYTGQYIPQYVFQEREFNSVISFMMTDHELLEKDMEACLEEKAKVYAGIVP